MEKKDDNHFTRDLRAYLHISLLKALFATESTAWRSTSLAINRDVFIDLDRLVRRAGKEHAIDSVTIGAIQLEVPPVESLCQDPVCLVEATEDGIVEPKAAAFADTAANLNL